MDNKKHGQMMREVILRAIIEYTEQHGYAPTYNEIGAMVGLKSKNTVWNHIQRMIAEGTLETDAKNDRAATRAIRVPGYKFVKQGEPKTNADRIRNMTDEELADFICVNFKCDCCPISKVDNLFFEAVCTAKNGEENAMLRKWLQKEVNQNHGK